MEEVENYLYRAVYTNKVSDTIRDPFIKMTLTVDGSSISIEVELKGLVFEG